MSCPSSSGGSSRAAPHRTAHKPSQNLSSQAPCGGWVCPTQETLVNTNSAPALPQNSCVTLGDSLHLSELQALSFSTPVCKLGDQGNGVELAVPSVNQLFEAGVSTTACLWRTQPSSSHISTTCEHTTTCEDELLNWQFAKASPCYILTGS